MRTDAAGAKRLAADPPALQAIVGPGGDPLSRLRRCSPGAAEAFEAYLERYCHRTVSYDPGDPTWFELPEVVAGLLAQQAQNSDTALDDIHVQHDALAQTHGELVGRSEEQKARFEHALAYARRAYGTREDTIFWLDSQPCALLRYCAVEVGRRLVERGVLVRAGDAVFLEEPELRDALTSSEGDDLHALVSRRKAEHG